MASTSSARACIAKRSTSSGGLELRARSSSVTLDGQRDACSRASAARRTSKPSTSEPTLAGDELEKRFQKRAAVTAGLHVVGVAFIKKSSATTLELLQPFERERLDPDHARRHP